MSESVDCGGVMVVEDDRDLREILVGVLRARGYATFEAGDGREALDLLRGLADPPCVVLLDIMMPVMDGFEFRAEQRADAKLAHIPVVVLTAHADARAVGRELDAFASIKKPAELRAILEAVRRTCRIRGVR